MKTLLLVLVALAGLQSHSFSQLRPNVPTVMDASRLDWFRQAKFGLFVHWGPYSDLAGEWRGRQVPVGRNAEWIMQILRIPAAEYRERAKQFNPSKFDADRWAKAAANAGMKYLVITAKHHDGFAMYHSKVSRYNIVDWTPFDRDPIRELAAACRREGIRFCVYYSHREDWDVPDAYGNDWDFDPAKKDFEKYLEEKSKPQLRELLTNYGPLGLIWFDRGLYTPKQAEEFVEIVNTLQPACLINGRVGNYGQELMGDYQNLNDNGMPPGGVEEYWETPQTLNETWGFSQFDHEWKPPAEVLRRLVEIVSKGGNYLLNVGPRGDGTIPEVSLATLERVGSWLRWNGDSIYGTTASPFGDLDWGRCTVKGSTLYLHVLEWPKDLLVRLPGLENRARRAYPLLDPDHQLEIARNGDVTTVKLPRKPLDADDTVVVLELDGPPRVAPLVAEQPGAGPIELDYLTATTSGKAVKRFNRGGSFHISKWTGPADAAAWRVRVTRPGRYSVRIEYAARADWAGQTYRLAVGGHVFTEQVEDTGDWYEYREFELGEADFAQPGVYDVSLRPESESGRYLMYFKSLRLVPAGE